MSELLTSPEIMHVYSEYSDKEQKNIKESKLYLRTVSKLKPGCVKDNVSPMVLSGVATREYVIIDILPDEKNDYPAVVHLLRARNFFAEAFRRQFSATEEGICIVICWDPVVISKSNYPKTYSLRGRFRVPCAHCSKTTSELKAACQGCQVFDMWLVSGAVSPARMSPCDMCAEVTHHKGKVPCTGCPAQRRYEALCKRATLMNQKPQTAVGDNAQAPAVSTEAQSSDMSVDVTNC